MGGILVAGPASDRIGNKIPITLTFVLRMFLFLLILKYQNLFSFYVFAIVFGFTFLVTAPLNTTLAGKMYGFRHIGLISGFSTTVHHLGGGFWAYMGGMMFDRTGSYETMFILSALLALAALVLTICIKEKATLYRLKNLCPEDPAVVSAHPEMVNFRNICVGFRILILKILNVFLWLIPPRRDTRLDLAGIFSSLDGH